MLLTSGKMYYDLVEAREKQKRHDVAILRVEQFYPLRDEVLSQALAALPSRNARPLGAGRTGKHGRLALLEESILPPAARPLPISFVARTPSASPATGSTAAHHREHDDLITRAFRILL